jgi:hypothetical protein
MIAKQLCGNLLRYLHASWLRLGTIISHSVFPYVLPRTVQQGVNRRASARESVDYLHKLGPPITIVYPRVFRNGKKDFKNHKHFQRSIHGISEFYSYCTCGACVKNAKVFSQIIIDTIDTNWGFHRSAAAT